MFITPNKHISQRRKYNLGQVLSLGLFVGPPVGRELIRQEFSDCDNRRSNGLFRKDVKTLKKGYKIKF